MAANTGDTDNRQSVNSIAVALPVPVVLLADLNDATNPINNPLHSGKARGCLVLADSGTALTLVTAAGSAVADVWQTVGTTTATTVATPV